MSQDFLNSKENKKTEEAPSPFSVSTIQSTIQPKVFSTIQPRLISSLTHEEEETAVNTSNTHLPEEVQAKMENSFGQDFSEVNIHSNSSQATDIGAQAFAQGNDIHFAPGKYDTNSLSGQELLGHELTHVVQQNQGKTGPGNIHGKGLNINTDPALEKEADEMGKMAAQGNEITPLHSTASTSLQMKADYNFEHRILKNETLNDIALYYNISIESIKKINPTLLSDQDYTEGKVIKVPSRESLPEEDKKTFKPYDKNASQPDLLGLIDKKKQVIEVTADDFDSFLKLYNKFNSPAAASGAVPAPALSDMKDLKYLLGPLQDQNPKIKEYVEKAKKIAEGDKDKLLGFLKDLWTSGLLGKTAILIPAAAGVTGAGIATVRSVKLTIEGKNAPTDDMIIKIAEQLLSTLEFKHEDKNISGDTTTHGLQFSENISMSSNETDQGVVKGKFEVKNNKPLDETDRKAWDEAKFTDKTVWYSVNQKDYYDTITLRHFIHQDPDKKIPDASEVVDASNVTTVGEMLQSVNDAEQAKNMKFFHLSDTQIYTYAQVVALFRSGSMGAKEKIAASENVQTVSTVDILARKQLYAGEIMTAGLEANAGIGFNTGLNKMNYQFGGSFNLTFPGKMNDSFLKIDYNQDKHYTQMGRQLNQWSELMVRDLMFKVGTNYKFDLGDFHHSLGADLSYKHTNQFTTNLTTQDKDIKNTNVFMLSPHLNINLNKDNTQMSLTIGEDFMMQDDKLKTALNLGLTGLKISKNSFIKIDLKLQDGKLKTADFTLFYLLH